MHFDEFNDIHASEETKNKTLAYVMRKQKNTPIKSQHLHFSLLHVFFYYLSFLPFLQGSLLKTIPYRL